MLGLIGLMFLSVDPQVQYTVDEVMEAPEEFATDDVNVRGNREKSIHRQLFLYLYFTRF